MAYKCKVCGYKFKADDLYVCPECFTQRDDYDCNYYEEGHTHTKDTEDYPEDDFLAHELKEERQKTKENIKRYKRENEKYAWQNPTQAEALRANFNSRQPSQSTIKSNYNNGKSTLTYTTSYNYNTNTYRTPYNNSTNDNVYVNPIVKKIVPITIILIIITITLPLLIAVNTSINDDDNDNYDNYYDEDEFIYTISEDSTNEALTAYVDLSSVYI
ncbi:MAG: hypothetical protein LUE12_02540 [Ruminococcus sp.]|nr:hypothetical protein [Ruminococcus sp.]